MNQETDNTEQELQAVRGMRDFLPEESAAVSALEDGAREVFKLFNYGEIRTPALEPSALFQRAIGEATDIVEKEMFTLKDRGERSLTLRPEGTAGVVRAYIEHSLGKKQGINKLFYIGPMFRAERPQAGRFRQFIQIGSEYFGSAAPVADAETIKVAAAILSKAGAGQFEVQINSLGCAECRPKYLEVLKSFLNKIAGELCKDCRNRMARNPLRALDCKVDRDKISKAPSPLDHLCEACKAHHEEVKKLLDGVDFREAPQMVRGLDYYTRTVFEIYPKGKEGSQDALAAGGRYDRLVEDLGGEKTPAVGFAMGLERVLAQLKGHAPRLLPGIFVAAIGNEALGKAFEILSSLRAGGLRADGLTGPSLKSQMRTAAAMGMRYCVIIGEDELKKGEVALKDLADGAQEMVPMKDLVETLQLKTKNA